MKARMAYAVSAWARTKAMTRARIDGPGLRSTTASVAPVIERILPSEAMGLVPPRGNAQHFLELSSGELLGADHAGVEEDHQQDGSHQDEAQSRCLRVVRDHLELRLDHVSDHVLARRPEQLSVAEVARRRDEGQERAREDAWQGKREGDSEEGLHPVRVQV